MTANPEAYDQYLSAEVLLPHEGEMMKATVNSRTTTKGWELHVKWHDGSTNWIPLKDLKHSNPVEVAEYATIAKLAEERLSSDGSVCCEDATGSLARLSCATGRRPTSSVSNSPSLSKKPLQSIGKHKLISGARQLKTK